VVTGAAKVARKTVILTGLATGDGAVAAKFCGGAVIGNFAGVGSAAVKQWEGKPIKNRDLAKMPAGTLVNAVAAVLGPPEPSSARGLASAGLIAANSGTAVLYEWLQEQVAQRIALASQ
jgi:hypothetical protein